MIHLSSSNHVQHVIPYFRHKQPKKKVWQSWHHKRLHIHVPLSKVGITDPASLTSSHVRVYENSAGHGPTRLHAIQKTPPRVEAG
jgi:hypothetical protein